MSVLLADVDATCSSLGWDDGSKYHMEPDAIQGLKHLIWILRRDAEDHQYRRYIGQKKVMQTDLIPMLMSNFDNPEVADVLLRLIVNLTYPTLLLYQGRHPKEAVGRRNFLHLVEILQGYKEAFAVQQAWAALAERLQKVLQVDWAERVEDQELIIERILTLTRNVLQVPSSDDSEKRFDNDASVHDQVLWALQQTGVLDLILYIIGSEYEHQYHLHALEIICLIYREQSATSLADASLQRSAIEKQRDEMELIIARKREKAKLQYRAPAARHSRFGGTYVMENIKSISDNDLICHQSLQKALKMEFDADKDPVKKSFRHVKETGSVERKSAFSVRLFLREYCIEILQASYNNLVREVRRMLERHAGKESGGGHDDSYLLWAIRFFMEFNRANNFQLELVSESLSVQCFHWIISRVEHYVEMMGSDKTRARLWARRLHVAVQAYREMLHSLQALQTVGSEKAKELFSKLQNNVFYVLEYREIVLHLLISYNESNSTKAYLRDVIETSHMFFKMLEKYCQGSVRVQSKKRAKTKRNKSATASGRNKATQQDPALDAETLEELWLTIAGQVSICLANQITLPEEDHPIPFDAASDIPIDDQKGECMIRIHSLLRNGKYEHAIILMRSAREVWPEDDCFGAPTSAPEDELMLLREVFAANLPKVAEKERVFDMDASDANENDYDDEEEEDESEMTEVDFKFEDFAKRLLNPKVVRACTLVLADWEHIPSASLKAAVTILHRIAVGCKMPAMLFQASLFRIFQSVFHAPKDAHQVELRRLGVYIVRQFTSLAPNNPKIYAELLFYKSIKEANAIEMGYEDIYGNSIGTGGGGIKGAWSEEQEEELRRLYMENQENPESDQDVIDWILDNLIDKTRTRRSVIKKLKELGLIFKAPTKKSNAAALNKNLWSQKQDDQLRQLYEEHRLNENVLSIITGEFDGVRSKQAIVNRMVTIGLIADKSEVKPRKFRSKKSSAANEGMSTEDSMSDEDSDQESNIPVKATKAAKPSKTKTTVKKKCVPTKTSLNTKRLRNLLAEIEESMKEAIEWLAESFSEACDDYEAGSEDPDDGVPLVPIMTPQRDALENTQFKELLKELGVAAPHENEAYWRIPVSLKPKELQLRVKILNGEYRDELEDESQPLAAETVSYPSDEEEPEVSEDVFSAWRKKNNVLYSKSDDESEVREPLKQKPRKECKKSKPKGADERQNASKKRKDTNNKFNLDDLAKQNDDEPDRMDSDVELYEDERENLEDFPSHRSLVVSDDENDFDSTDGRSTAAANMDTLKNNKKTKLKASIMLDSDSEPEADGKQFRLVVSDEEGEGQDQIHGGSSSASTVKRTRSDQSDEDEVVQKKAKHHRRAVISDDDED
ncbi:protein timeless homolog [Toxorhynchites rutilus septentrionalis]|uniref:protein timeless homolog n=1 Tax=Toxorhynchites rutilus septentrionalis TaxID=329112 RepID=UPI002478C63C|nr:protein timeless homolog [Toxorhynchites rutilus septentrionalis]